eukprot:8904588-Pyramimonas_sp.AAC.1
MSQELTSAPSGQIHDAAEVAVIPTRLREARRAQKGPWMEGQGWANPDSLARASRRPPSRPGKCNQEPATARRKEFTGNHAALNMASEWGTGERISARARDLTLVLQLTSSSSKGL